MIRSYLARRVLRRAGIAALLGSLAWLTAPLANDEKAYLLAVSEIIGPASSDFIIRGIERAEERGAELVILRLNTPGGLDSAMRDIIQKILASRVPVVTYVAPSGARAASAGTYILYASHVAAMAPATNLGAATPVQVGPGGIGDEDHKPGKPAKDAEDQEDQTEKGDGDKQAAAPGSAMERKLVNDAVAYIRGLAKLRGRNAEWAEKAVRQAESLTAEDALEQNVIDLVARNVDDLLQQLNGRSVETAAGGVTLQTSEIEIETLEPDWRSRLLAVITNPNVAYILMLVGVYGLMFELSNPGSVFPGVTGAICLLLALYAFQVLPVNYAGMALILLGISLMIGELFVPSFGVLGIGGTIAFIVGSIILVETDIEAFQISLPVIVSVTAVTALLIFVVIALALKQRRRPVVSGREEMFGAVGEATSDFTDEGQIHIHGELWQARTNQPVGKGQRVRVTDIDGLTLLVEPLVKGETQ